MITRNLRGKALEEYKETLSLSEEQKDVIIGTLLGDSSIPLNKGKPAYHIKFEQGELHKSYLFHLYSIFEPFTGGPPDKRSIEKGKRFSYKFRTYRHKCFIFYFNLFYQILPVKNGEKVEKIKRVPKNIHRFLTPRALAYWFMDDGSINTGKKSFTFHTQRFQKHECELLCQALKRNFTLGASVQKDDTQWKVYINVETSPQFLKLILPYLHESMLYKIKDFNGSI